MIHAKHADDSARFTGRRPHVISERFLPKSNSRQRCRPAPGVFNTVNAQSIICPDRSFSVILSACFACIVFLHLR
jgi:hypothetical protein